MQYRIILNKHFYKIIITNVITKRAIFEINYKTEKLC